eukprot:SM000007S20863  [mRNA]  locus=s7:628871:631434:+ [translate_table: standard]
MPEARPDCPPAPPPRRQLRPAGTGRPVAGEPQAGPRSGALSSSFQAMTASTTVYVYEWPLRAAEEGARPPVLRLALPGLRVHGASVAAVRAAVQGATGVAASRLRILAPQFAQLGHHEAVPQQVVSSSRAHEVSPFFLELTTQRLVFLKGPELVELNDCQHLSDLPFSESPLHVHILPRPLHAAGGRLRVTAPTGLIVLDDVHPGLQVEALKQRGQSSVGFKAEGLTLVSLGLDLRDHARLNNIQGVHAVREDSILDVCPSGLTSKPGLHCHVLVSLKLPDGLHMDVVLQLKHTIDELLKLASHFTSVSAVDLQASFDGMLLEKDRKLADYRPVLHGIINVTSAYSQELSHTQALPLVTVNVCRSGQAVGTYYFPYQEGEKVGAFLHRARRHLTTPFVDATSSGEGNFQGQLAGRDQQAEDVFKAKGGPCINRVWGQESCSDSQYHSTGEGYHSAPEPEAHAVKLSVTTSELLPVYREDSGRYRSAASSGYLSLRHSCLGWRKSGLASWLNGSMVLPRFQQSLLERRTSRTAIPI